MSDPKQIRDDEPELSDEALEEVAGGCRIDSTGMQTISICDPQITPVSTDPTF